MPKCLCLFVSAKGLCPLLSGCFLDLLTTWPTLKNFLFVRGTWRKRTAGRLTLMLGGLVTGVTPLAHLQNFPCPQSSCHLGSLFCNSRRLKPYQISSLGTGTWPLTCTHHRMITEERIYSPSYYNAFETGGHIVKRHIFQLFMAQFFTYQFVYFYISDLIQNYKPKLSLPKRHLNFSICVGKSVTSTVQPGMTYIYLCGNGMQFLHCLFFKLPFCNSARSKLNCKTGMKEHVYHWHFIK